MVLAALITHQEHRGRTDPLGDGDDLRGLRPAVMQMEELGNAINALMPKLTMEESTVALEIYSGLAETGTISLPTLSERTGIGPERVEAIVTAWPGVYRDERADIVGFWGLTAKPLSKHRLRIQSQDRYAWCAWDCLFLPALLRQPVHLDSVCKQSGEPIELSVSPGGVEEVQPRSTVLSMLIPDLERSRQDVVSNFCHFVFFFKDEAAGCAWTSAHPGTQIITLEQGLALGRMKNEWQFGAGPEMAVTLSIDAPYIEGGHDVRAQPRSRLPSAPLRGGPA